MVLLETSSQDPQRYEVLLTAVRRWWMPALMHLAIELDESSPRGRSAMQDWSSRRQCCFYIVVQEETDDHLSLTASSWPLVDDRGRLRFPISADPVELHVERGEWQSFVDAHRAHWLELGMITPELATRPILLGDTFALRFDRPSGRAVDPVTDRLDRRGPSFELHLHPSEQTGSDGVAVMDVVAHPVPSGRNLRRSTVATSAGWLTDITWDARQAGKVAQLAAFAGVLDTEHSDTAGAGDDQRIREGMDLQFRAVGAGADPDETLALDDHPPEPGNDN